MKFKITISWEYEVESDTAQKYYATTDPDAMAKIDEAGFRDDPEDFMGDLYSKPYIVTIVPVKEA